MRRAIPALLVTVVVVVLLTSFKSRGPALTAVAPPASGSSASRSTAASSASGSTGGTARRRRSTRRPAAKPGAAHAAVGAAIQYQFGVVQLKATVRGGQLTAVQTVVMNPNGGRSQAIDAQVVPMLQQEALQVHSAKIDVVSGATYTSDAYAQSLQSAIDRARSA